jgi:hypothetical protein
LLQLKLAQLLKRSALALPRWIHKAFECTLFVPGIFLQMDSEGDTTFSVLNAYLDYGNSAVMCWTVVLLQWTVPMLVLGKSRSHVGLPRRRRYPFPCTFRLGLQ